MDDIQVSWGVSHLDTGELEVTPTFTQVHFDEPGVRGHGKNVQTALLMWTLCLRTRPAPPAQRPSGRC